MTNRMAIIISILIPSLTLLANSDILMAEFFTSFEIDPRIAYPEKENIIYVHNTGSLQASNVILTLYANGTINDFRDACPEGNMYQMDNKTLVAEFERMSPHMLCQFVLVVSEPVRFDVAAFTSDHRSIWAPEVFSPSFPALAMFTGVILIIEFIILILFFTRLVKGKFIYWVVFKLQQNKFKKAKYVHETRELIFDEYGIQINEIDATVLELIHSQKKTKNQLRKHSGLTMPQVEFCIRKLKQLELLTDSMELDLALDEYFDSKRRDSYRKTSEDKSDMPQIWKCPVRVQDQPPLTRAGDQDNFTHWLTPIDLGR